jgi:anti-anti-sigma factor
MSEHPHPPSLIITVDEHQTYAVVHVTGKLVAGVTEQLHRPVAALFPTHKRIILDLCHLTHMDSMGIGALLRLYVSGKAHHCTIECRNLGERIRELMIMTNLLPVFTAVGEHGMRMP